MAKRRTAPIGQESVSENVVLHVAADGEIGARNVLLLKNVAGKTDIEVPMGWTLTEGLDQIAEHQKHLSYHEAMVIGAVVGARVAGASWASIGQVLGITRQSANERFSPWETQIPK